MTTHRTTGTSATPARSVARWLLGAALVTAGTAHLTFGRKDFQAQVPDWVPMDKDDVVLISGAVEICLGSALALLPREQRRLGLVAATFFTAVFPGNVAQYTEGRDAFGLDTDRKRALRLLGQPVFVAWAWWATRPRIH